MVGSVEYLFVGRVKRRTGAPPVRGPPMLDLERQFRSEEEQWSTTGTGVPSGRSREEEPLDYVGCGRWVVDHYGRNIRVS